MIRQLSLNMESVKRKKIIEAGAVGAGAAIV